MNDPEVEVVRTACSRNLQTASWDHFVEESPALGWRRPTEPRLCQMHEQTQIFSYDLKYRSPENQSENELFTTGTLAHIRPSLPDFCTMVGHAEYPTRYQPSHLPRLGNWEAQDL
jgi:hypothetical protein